jgi:predicted DNA-binding antitoxin AbrB/MazE fold protein
MSQYITATFEDGVLKPHEKLDLAAGSKVNLVITPCGTGNGTDTDALAELDQFCDEEPIDSGGFHLTREQLHERN